MTNLNRARVEFESDSRLLVEGISKGNKRSEYLFVIKYRNVLIQMLINLGSNRALAEDLVHETLIIVLKKLRHSALENPDKLSTYIYQTAKFTFYGWLRKMENQFEFSGNLDSFETQGLSLECELSRHEEQRMLHCSIFNLRIERDRDILHRRYVQEQNTDEICEALDITSMGFNRIVSRARTRLKEELVFEGH